MGIMSDIDIEIRNSKALSYMWHQIEQLEKRVTKLDEKKVCGQCKTEVPANEFHLVYKDRGLGVCEACWQKHYIPYMG